MGRRMASSRREGPWSDRRAGWTAVVVGCGLIGGSVALAIRRRWPRARVWGIDRPGVLRRTIGRGAVDEGAPPGRLDQLVEQTRPALIVLAMPLPAIVSTLPRLAAVAQALPPGERPLVTDVGSVKRTVVAAAEACGCPRFVGGHPMAGSERGGIEHARDDLFDGRRFVLCPSSTSRVRDVAAMRRFVEGLGAQPLCLDAALHDRCVAVTSHLPHLGALTLMEVGRRLQVELDRRSTSRGAALPWSLAAGAWRDATRVAAADVTLWKAIFEQNADAVIDGLDAWIDVLSRLRRALGRRGGLALSGGRDGLDAAELVRMRAKLGRILPPPGR